MIMGYSYTGVEVHLHTATKYHVYSGNVSKDFAPYCNIFLTIFFWNQSKTQILAPEHRPQC